ncbi:MAG: hypothetical protein JSV80_11920 [Acidobacteriota bacterium]|nr:MAG: hypothetical protein JSV80_11920 [Acidobacteriota bacterium]
MKPIIGFMIAALLLPVLAQAAAVEVEITGYVEYNQIRSGQLSVVSPNDPVTMYFQVDSGNFLDSSTFPTRGYGVIHETYSYTLGPVTVGLQDPYPAGRVPYFVIRNNDPQVDGFFMSDNNVDWPFPPPPLDEPGRFGPFGGNFEVGYTGDTLQSLDILDALGTYDYDGLTNFYFVISDGPFDAMGLIFQQMTIRLVPVEVADDVKPGSCPNPVNVTSRGTLPVAILGTADLDVTTIDPDSIRLAGVPALSSSF